MRYPNPRESRERRGLPPRPRTAGGRQLEAAGFAIVEEVEDWNNGRGKWFVVDDSNGERITFLRENAVRWHAFYNAVEATGSGHDPRRALTGGLGEVIGDDRDLRLYCKAVLMAPDYLKKVSAGLWAAQRQCYEEDRGRQRNPAGKLVAYYDRESDDPETGAPGILRTEWRVSTIRDNDDYDRLLARWGERWSYLKPGATHTLDQRYIRRGVEEPWQPHDLYMNREDALDDIDTYAVSVDPKLTAIQYARIARDQAAKAAAEAEADREAAREQSEFEKERAQAAFARMMAGADPVGRAAAFEWQEFVGKKKTKAQLAAFQADPKFMSAYNTALSVDKVPAKRKAVVEFLRHAKLYDPDIRVPNPPPGTPPAPSGEVSDIVRMENPAENEYVPGKGVYVGEEMGIEIYNNSGSYSAPRFMKQQVYGYAYEHQVRRAIRREMKKRQAYEETR